MVTDNYKIWTKENTIFVLLFILAISAVYFAPFIVNQIFFLFIIFFAYRSKKDYFWIAFLFLLLDAPGRLFLGGDINDVHRLAFYPILPGVVLQFRDLFLLMYLFKIFNKKRKYSFVFRSDIHFLFLYSLIVITYSFVFRMNADSIIRMIRLLLPWSLIFVLPQRIDTESEFKEISKLLFPFVFVALASQLYTYSTGHYFLYLVKGVETVQEELLLLTKDASSAMRAADSTLILIFCFTQALFYLFKKGKLFPELYLYAIIIVAALSTFLSATRGWILAYLFILSMLLITNSRPNRKYFIRIGVTAGICIVLFSYYFPLLNVQIKNVTNRLETIAALTEGDITAGGTLSRLDLRGPRVLKKYWESPILGWGFSTNFFNFADGHIGHHTMLLNVGIVGYVILNFIYFKWCTKIYIFAKSKAATEKYGVNTIKILFYLLLALYVVHSTSAMSWGIAIGATRIILYSLILSFFNLIYQSTVCVRNAQA